MENGLWRRIREKWENTTNCMVDRRWPQLEVLCALTSTPLPWICCHRLFIFIRICLLIWELSYSIGVTERRSGQWRALAGQCLTSSDMLEFLVLCATAAGAGRLFSSIQHFFFCVFLFLYTCTADNRKWMSMNPSACSVLTAHTHYQIRCIMGISCEWAIPATATNKPLKNARLRNNLVANSIYFTFRYGLLCAPAKCNART